jgi:SP family sugar:H+ symporter-like MFS transporter
MPGGGIILTTPTDVNRIEAPVTMKAYFMCAFAAFAGIFFGFDTGYINGTLAMTYFIHQFTGLPVPGPDASADELANFVIPAWRTSLIVSILSAGTFTGAVAAGDVSDFYGRRTTIMAGCVIFSIGIALQVASSAYGLLIAGRLIAGIGVGFVSAIVILYMSEIAPRKVRGLIIAGYQFCITLGILLANCVVYGTQDFMDSRSYRVPMGIQWVWAIIVFVGLLLLPESPRYFVKRGNLEEAAKSLSRVRGQPIDSEYIRDELAEIVANNEYEKQLIGDAGFIGSWMNCFKGSIRDPSSNLRRSLLGTSAQMFQQFTGINFIFYFGTTFFNSLHTISNPFLISLITTLVNVCSTPVSFWTVERFGRRPLLIWGALGMVICEFIVAIIGTADGSNPKVVAAQISFICIYIFFFASTWGPGAWVVVGEMFPLPIRSRGVAMSVAANWFWNCIIAVITPYMVNVDEGNMGSKVFFVWGSLCIGCFLWAYFIVFETKGLSLEQVDKLLVESTPRASKNWVPHETFASHMHRDEKDGLATNVVDSDQKVASEV